MTRYSPSLSVWYTLVNADHIYFFISIYRDIILGEKRDTHFSFRVSRQSLYIVAFGIAGNVRIFSILLQNAKLRHAETLQIFADTPRL